MLPTLASATAPTANKHRHHYPVTWNFLVNAFATASTPADDPPLGSDLPCHPTERHPRPVVLVHGLMANQGDDWAAISPFLANHGYCVFSLTYGTHPSAPGFMKGMGGLADMRTSAHRLARFVQHVLHVTGARKVDLIGHSEGGTMPDWYLKFDHGNRYVDHFVEIAGASHGSKVPVGATIFSLFVNLGFENQSYATMKPYCASCLQFMPNSRWMKALDKPHPHATARVAATCRADGAAVVGIKYFSVATRYDELIYPSDSDFKKPSCANDHRIGVHNLLIQHQCPQDLSDHLSIAADPNVAHDILNALDPAHAHRVRCRTVLPSLG
jgi:hypothetical protein